MKRMKFIWKIEIDVTEDEVRDFLGLDEDDETELDYSDFRACAWDMIENEDCEFDLYSAETY